jgi:hypothetical protein
MVNMNAPPLNYQNLWFTLTSWIVFFVVTPRCPFTDVSEERIAFIFRSSWQSWIIALMMEAVRTSETLVNFYQTIRRYNPEGSHLQKNMIDIFTAVETSDLRCFDFINEFMYFLVIRRMRKYFQNSSIFSCFRVRFFPIDYNFLPDISHIT